MSEPASTADFTSLTADIVSAYVVNNKIELSGLAGLIQSVHQALCTIDAPKSRPTEETAKATPSQIRKSITPDAIISFEDGKPYKTLKRHLSRMGLTVSDYKSKWGLPSDYPVTAPNYSAHRSAMAKSLGLGNKGRAKAKAPKTPRKRKAAAEHSAR